MAQMPRKMAFCAFDNKRGVIDTHWLARGVGKLKNNLPVNDRLGIMNENNHDYSKRFSEVKKCELPYSRDLGYFGYLKKKSSNS